MFTSTPPTTTPHGPRPSKPYVSGGVGWLMNEQPHKIIIIIQIIT